jgi:hypothetical protein
VQIKTGIQHHKGKKQDLKPAADQKEVSLRQVKL